MRKNITGNYYLVENDSRENLSVCYKTEAGDCIGRVPPKILKYGFTDSILVVQSQQNDNVKFYVVDIKKDSDYADEKDYLIGTYNEAEYLRRWGKLHLKSVKD